MRARLFAALLLKKGLQGMGFQPELLEHVRFTPYGRPFIDEPVDFNISHSDAFVVCAIVSQGRVGIDIEKVQSIELSDFENNLTHDEWNAIQGSDDKHKMFYEYWTKKESVMKADGRGLSVPLSDILIDGDRAELNGHTWHLKELSIHPDYCCHLAAELRDVEITLRRIHFQ
jgi:4'-phosphopantetheinyl transferase